MAVRVLLLVAVLMALYGYEQSSPASEQAEKKDFEQLPVREKTGKATQEMTQSAQQAATVACSGFYGPQEAQAYYYDTRATAADKEALNPDGDERAFNEEGVGFAPEPTDMATTEASASASSSETGSVVADSSDEEREEQAEGSCRVVGSTQGRGRGQNGEAFWVGPHHDRTVYFASVVGPTARRET